MSPPPGTAFLGLTVNCARCHDHKFDPITQRDYYGLQAVFAGVAPRSRSSPRPTRGPPGRGGTRRRASWPRSSFASTRSSRRPGPSRTRPSARMVNPPPQRRSVPAGRRPDARVTILATGNRPSPASTSSRSSPREALRETSPWRHPEGRPRPRPNTRATAIHKIAHLNDGQTGNSHSWISPGSRQGALHDRMARGRDGRPRSSGRAPSRGSTRDRLADRVLLMEVAPEARRVARGRLVARSPPVRPTVQRRSRGPDGTDLRAGLASGRADVPSSRPAGGWSSSVTRSRSTPGPSASPGPPTSSAGATRCSRWPRSLPSGLPRCGRPWCCRPDAPRATGELTLARWIGDPANPLPARVMANRVWHYHFGQGIVATPSDFGFNGGPPSHPELLDWLAARYVAGGWRLKPLHRLILLSADLPPVEPAGCRRPRPSTSRIGCSGG